MKLLNILFCFVIFASFANAWLTDYNYRQEFSCANAGAFPIVLNGSTGYSIGGTVQYIWASCSSTRLYLYFNDSTKYTVTASNDTIIPFEVENGTGTSYLPTSVWTGYTWVHHMNHVKDSTLNYNTTNTGVDFTTGKIGYGGYADSATDRLALPALNIDAWTEISFCSWMKLADKSKSQAWAFATGADASFGEAPQIYYQNATNTINWSIGTGATHMISSFTAPDQNTWFYMCGVAKEATYSYAVYNGAFQTSGGTGSWGNPSTAQFILNQNSVNNALFGYMDEVRLANRIMTSAEINTSYYNALGYAGYGSATGDIQTATLNVSPSLIVPNSQVSINARFIKPGNVTSFNLTLIKPSGETVLLIQNNSTYNLFLDRSPTGVNFSTGYVNTSFFNDSDNYTQAVYPGSTTPAVHIYANYSKPSYTKDAVLTHIIPYSYTLEMYPPEYWDCDTIPNFCAVYYPISQECLNENSNYIPLGFSFLGSDTTPVCYYGGAWTEITHVVSVPPTSQGEMREMYVLLNTTYLTNLTYLFNDTDELGIYTVRLDYVDNSTFYTLNTSFTSIINLTNCTGVGNLVLYMPLLNETNTSQSVYNATVFVNVNATDGSNSISTYIYYPGNAQHNVSLCTVTNGSFNYTANIEWIATTYVQRSYYLYNQHYNTTQTNFTLYFLPSASAMLTQFRVLSQSNEPIPDVPLYLRKEVPTNDSNSNLYVDISSVFVDSKGEGWLYLIADKYYKFKTLVEGEYVLPTSSLGRQISTNTEIIDIGFNTGGLGGYWNTIGYTSYTCNTSYVTNATVCGWNSGGDFQNICIFYGYFENGTPIEDDWGCNTSVSGTISAIYSNTHNEWYYTFKIFSNDWRVVMSETGKFTYAPTPVYDYTYGMIFLIAVISFGVVLRIPEYTVLAVGFCFLASTALSLVPLGNDIGVLVLMLSIIAAYVIHEVTGGR